jgi:hypothetical protein
LDKKVDKSMVFGLVSDAGLPSFKFLDRCPAFLEKDTVTAVRAPDIDIDLDFLLAPCTLVGTCHVLYPLFPAFFDNSTVDCTLGNLHGRCRWLVCTARKLVPALAALPDTRPLARYGFHIAFRAAVECT